MPIPCAMRYARCAVRGRFGAICARPRTPWRQGVGSARQISVTPATLQKKDDGEERETQSWEKRFGKSAGLPDFIEQWSPAMFKKVGIAMVVADMSYFAWEWTCFEMEDGVSTFNEIQHLLPPVAMAFPIAAYWYIGIRDMKNETHAIRRNFPVLGNVRYILESFRPEIRQYFVEGNTEGAPYDRNHRSIAYSRAKAMNDTLPLGTQRDVYKPGYEWCNHSMFPKHPDPLEARVTIGGKDCKHPYSASVLNVSAMSYGALSGAAITALNMGAAKGNFYHNTGEGGISRFHQTGADIVWNVGTGYFGCRTADGAFCPEMFKDRVSNPNVKMVEIKLSQGAKPGHGGLLPGAKITDTIREARGLPPGFAEDVNSPPSHSAFDGPISMMHFIAQVRELSDGKPVGFKLCVGRPEEFAALVAAMVQTGIAPDFITVDGGEGGTGAAPPEFSNSVGMPLVEGLGVVNALLCGAGLRDLRTREGVKIICSGRVLSGFSLARNLAIGADSCNAARSFMLALGCIQALKCDTNHCPTGIATQREDLQGGLVVPDKAGRVYQYQKKTVESMVELVGAMGLSDYSQLQPEHIMRRVDMERTVSYRELAQLNLGDVQGLQDQGGFQGADLSQFTTPGDLRLQQWWEEGQRALK